MNKKLQVFVSSTYTDLIEERQAAVEAILDAGHIPAGMELFKAGKSQMKTIQKWIDESDVYMLILGGRYGSIEEESGLSYTELEYKYALSKNMPVFAIVLDDSFLFTKAASNGKDAIFEKDNIKKYEVFKTLVKSNIVKFVQNIDNIESVIHSHLNYILSDSEYNLIGWVRNYNDINTQYEQNNLKITTITNQIQLTEKDFENLYLILKNEIFKKKFLFFFTYSHNALEFFLLRYKSLCAGITKDYISNKNFEIYAFLQAYNLVEHTNNTYQIGQLGVLFYLMYNKKFQSKT